MSAPFYVAAAVALVSTLMVVTRTNAVHALLYLIVSLLAVAAVLDQLGAPFIAALEVIVYAGAIMVVFVFVVMMLNLGVRSEEQERGWLRPQSWIGPAALAAILAAELVYTLAVSARADSGSTVIAPRLVGRQLFGAYFVGVELASLLLLAGLVGALHLSRTTDRTTEPAAPMRGAA